MWFYKIITRRKLGVDKNICQYQKKKKIAYIKVQHKHSSTDIKLFTLDCWFKSSTCIRFTKKKLYDEWNGKTICKTSV